MSYTVYILYSAQLDQYYIGHTADISDRINRHQHHGSKSTRKASDWKIVYEEQFNSRSEAMSRELAIKKRKSRQYIEALVSSTG